MPKLHQQPNLFTAMMQFMNIGTKKPNEQQEDAWVLCSVCCQDKPKASMTALSTCSHKAQFCKDCITQWIEKIESSGQEKQPNCPFCRTGMAEDDIRSILGRSFQPAQSSSNNNQESAPTTELDDLTLQWLQQQTKPCPRCGAHIQKEEDSCDLMECLCGYRFCYNCGSQGAQCSCTPESHHWWDNVLDQSYSEADETMTRSNDTGSAVDIKARIEQKIRMGEQERVREERSERREDNVREIKYMDEFTSSAKWLFKSNAVGMRVLDQRHKGLAKSAASKAEKEIAQYQQMHQANDYNLECTYPQWMFATHSKEAAARVLQQQLKASSMVRRRTNMERVKAKEVAEAEEFVLQALWLFGSKYNAASTKIIEQQSTRSNQRLRIHRKTQAKMNRKEMLEVEGLDAEIAYGTWMFADTHAAATILRLEELCEEQEEADQWAYEW